MSKKGALSDIHKRLVTHFGSTEKLTILDYGCGTGGLTRVLLDNDKHPNLIVAVDSDPKMIEKITSSFSSEIALGQVNTEVISDPRQLLGKLSYDGIFCHNVLELIDDKEHFVASLTALLKEEGTLIVSHMDFDSMLYNSSYKELTRNLIHHFADTKQAWMSSLDGQVGRKIPGILKRANIQTFSFETWRLTESSFQEHDYGFIMARLLLETASQIFDQEELRAWKEDLEDKVQNHDYFFAIDLDVAKITK